MKVLIAICTCHAFRPKAQAQRDTWLKDLPEGVDYKFFLGQPHPAETRQPLSDEVWLDAPDDYHNFPLKVIAMRRWAHEAGYDYVCKMDDDVYAVPARLVATIPVGHDYVGRLRGPSGSKPAPYNSGFCYWMSRRAIEALLDAKWDRDGAEDRWTANELYKRGIRAVPDYRFVVATSQRNGVCAKEPPRCDNDTVAACEYGAAEMRQRHIEYKNGRPTGGIFGTQPKKFMPAGELSEVSVMIKTFLRDGYLFAALKGLERKMPECKILVVDDGYEHRDKVTRYSELRGLGHACVWMPFDSGFGAKANEAIRYLRTRYVLIGSDDFNFENPAVRAGVSKMYAVMEARTDMGVASGRVGGRPYESCLQIEDKTVREVPGHRSTHRLSNGVVYHECDLTVNYSLIRREVFDKVRWDEDVKIGGGEHGAFFLDVMNAGWKVCVVEDAPIWEFLPNAQWESPLYRGMRARAKEPGLPCVKRRGFDYWICQDGRKETA